MKRKSRENNTQQRFERPNRKIYGSNGPWSRATKAAIETKTNPNQGQKTKLYHFSLYEPPRLAQGNLMQTITPTFYHTDPNWRYFERSAKGGLVVEIPTAELMKHGVTSRCYCSIKNRNEKCFVTWILPPFYAAFDRENSVLYKFGNGRSPEQRNIPRQHVKWVQPSGKLNIQSKHDEILGPYLHVGNDPIQ